MLRWLGAALILCGGLLVRRELVEERRQAQRTRLELASAFETMSTEIAMLLTPIPALLRRDYGEQADRFCATMLHELDNRGALVEAWRKAAAELPLPQEERAALASAGSRLDCGEEGARAALTLAAETERASYEKEEAKNDQNERVITSICVSISLFLTIILF